jgi:predicted alpha/beta-fold hydrolase
MPLLSRGDDFIPVKRFRNGHYNTFIPALFYKNPKVDFERVRIETPDDDFIDIDSAKVGANKAVIILHGLEGSSSSGYVLHFADYFNQQGYDVICPNYRGCSGEMNRQLRMYNSGTTDDVHHIVKETARHYDSVDLIGFSLGGNLVLKYLGEQVYELPQNLIRGVAISAPIHLHNASLQLLRPQNFAYQIRFIISLWGKAIAKKKQFPKEVKLPLWKMRNLYRFDEYFTAPVYGYADAKDYYDDNSSLQFLETLERPALLINSYDDPFLGDLCYPTDIAERSEQFHLITTQYGGHVGFARDGTDRNWFKEKALSFLTAKEFA